ncbi:2,4-dienoyl-CoA reductase-like NADH-dependent reductase (Old Yellow Enzyme family)/thioredoxin reductase [Clostridium acetobutylicum]|uniref:NADH:flavin oxidoreductase, possible NADH oxidase n=1 Tax=Clostridium acetobutylicum (strain ATCC 824 / DSM 792 / JCM 1419 / IAM 19013 / LMG 5710 / NBRC 13948 / NRRL B-527 / VKM B-1787 / 2291 / W) TaxID=272562 RepID=Q97K75_CLOAB|nr:MULTISPECIES: FAD-dependent oxidoreductase [Clostridium]AAK79020.1 NADH:flavin oxidoreductase, possible NADH oxidase [Clostridium acetobutylicum ATCC 824]ADZ20095.1 NADH:flavin oxidoreductase, possible NADH oxidase [Clostridium acetobutylicum EA 2018]AEI31575.1 NADH:flavin oxidoreductase, NADH oxidase [Clostridium acetobutylicum DSM 1731]AWV81724.1 NADH:flavin oxidoreductase [Clostridium acetobutylicum]MBC2395266.1 FAD-dependent oxidoreductase [Clostridium acetobutylicum]
MYKKLFEKGKIGELELKNRIVMVALAVGAAKSDQTIGDDMMEYYLERARGGVGLIIAENTRVNDENGVAARRQVSVARDEHIAPLKKLVDALHSENTKFFVQLHHPGRETYSNLNGDKPVVAPSAIPCGVCKQETRALETSEVEGIIQDFINGAKRAKKAGVDGVELHAAHGYLISQFLSPYTNKRTDKYGGSFEKRFNFVKEVVLGIKNACGQDYPISVRLTVDELLNLNGVKQEYLDLNMGIKICRELEKIGVDVINVSNGIYETFNSLSEPMTYDQGCRTERIKAVKEAVEIPVIAVNMIKEPWFAEKMLEDKLVDFIGLGRALVADSDWPKKALEGRDEDINRCISCTFCFETLLDQVIPNVGPIKCAVNPRAAHEFKYKEFNKNGADKVVAVVGAGVAGLEAARVLKIRGFKPVVLEQSADVGGQINVADKPPRKEKIDWIVEYEKTQLNKMGVEIKLNTKVTLEYLKKMKPYAVFIATGSVPLVPKSIKGIDRENVYTIDDVLTGKVKIIDKKVALIGSGSSGLETAEFLCINKNDVSIIEMQDAIGKGVYVQHYLDAMDKLSKFKVNYMPSNKLLEVTNKGVKLENIVERRIVDYDTDYVVLSLGVKANNDLEALCKAEFENVRVIGDAAAVGRIESSVRSGFEAAFWL